MHIAEKNDKELVEFYSKNVDWMIKFSDDEHKILEMIPDNEDSLLRTQKKNELAQLAKLHNTLIQSIDFQNKANELKTVQENFLKTNFIPKFVEIKQKKLNEDKAIDELVQPLKEYVDKVNRDVKY